MPQSDSVQRRYLKAKKPQAYMDEEDKMWLHFISQRVIENPLSDGCDDKGLQLKHTFMCCSWAELYFGWCVIGVAVKGVPSVWQYCGNVVAILWQCCVQRKGVPGEILFNDWPQQLANTSLSPHRRIGAYILMMTMLWWWAEITKCHQYGSNHQLTDFELPAVHPCCFISA